MFSADDLLNLLNRIPLWKKISSMPARIEELEKRIAELEKEKLATQKSNEDNYIIHNGVAYCAKCKVPMVDCDGILLCFDCDKQITIEHHDITKTIAELKL